MTTDEGTEHVAGHYVSSSGAWVLLPGAENTGLFNAVVEDNVNAVEKELENNPSALQVPLNVAYHTQRDQNTNAKPLIKSRTLLMLASYHGSLRVVSCLLGRGADTRAVAPDGLTAAEFAKMAVGCANAPIALAMLLDAAEPRGHALDPVVAAPRTPRAYSEVGSSPDRLGNAAGYSVGPFDMLGNAGRYQEVEADPFHPEGMPYSTSDLTRPEYSTDNFRLFCFKALRCSKRYAHDWRACPFAHPTENARRRDPREFRYCAIACPDYKQGFCARGDACCFSHGVFECWLHPSRYRTQLCKDGANCGRPVCFFAHSLSELRTPTHTWTPGPEDLAGMNVLPAGLPMGGAGGPRAAGQAQGGRGGVMGESLLPGNAVAWHSPQAPKPPIPRVVGSPTASFPVNRGSQAGVRRPSSEAHPMMGKAGPPSATPSGSVPSTAPSDRSSASSTSSPPPPGAEQRRPTQQPRGPGGGGLLHFTPPRMSNEFARRHGLNPRDNPMLNLQKIALQSQMMAAAQQQPGMMPGGYGPAMGPGMGMNMMGMPGMGPGMGMGRAAAAAKNAFSQQQQQQQQQHGALPPELQLMQMQQMQDWSAAQAAQFQVPTAAAAAAAYAGQFQQDQQHRDQYRYPDQQQQMAAAAAAAAFAQQPGYPFAMGMAGMHPGMMPGFGMQAGAGPMGMSAEAHEIAMLHQQLAALSMGRPQNGNGAGGAAGPGGGENHSKAQPARAGGRPSLDIGAGGGKPAMM